MPLKNPVKRLAGQRRWAFWWVSWFPGGDIDKPDGSSTPRFTPVGHGLLCLCFRFDWGRVPGAGYMDLVVGFVGLPISCIDDGHRLFGPELVERVCGQEIKQAAKSPPNSSLGRSGKSCRRLPERFRVGDKTGPSTLLT